MTKAHEIQLDLAFNIFDSRLDCFFVPNSHNSFDVTY